jgi:hypothetical protein
MHLSRKLLYVNIKESHKSVITPKKVIALFVFYRGDMRKLLSIIATLSLLTVLFTQTAFAMWTPYKGLWLTRTELDSLPTTGKAWNNIVSKANASWGSAKISDQNSNHDQYVLAGALYATRMNNDAMRSKTANAIMSAIGTEKGGRVLALARNLTGYVLAADLINLPDYNQSMALKFSNWLSSVRTEKMTECDTLIKCHNRRPNNWGTYAGASRIAADLYLGDTDDLGLAAKTFKGWLGDRSAYSGFDYGNTSWQCDPSLPVGINRADCKERSSVLPDDMRRGGSYHIPPSHTDYPWGALSGAVIQAELLSRAGYPAWDWGYGNLNDKALYRAIERLDEFNTRFGGWWADGDDTPTVWIVDHAYNVKLQVSSTSLGKGISFTDWTHSR